MLGQPLGARDRERPHAAGVDLHPGGGREVEEDIDAAAQQVLIRRLRAAVRDVRQRGAGQVPECRGQHMLARAVAGRGIGQLAGVGAGEGHQFGQGGLRQVLARHQRMAVRDGQADRLEVAQAVVRQVAVQPHVEREVADRTGEQRIAVGRRLGRQVGAHQRARAGPVFDHHRLAELLRQPLGQHPRDKVETAARRLRHDDAQRPVGVGGLRCDAAAQAVRGNCGGGGGEGAVSIDVVGVQALAHQRSCAPPTSQRAPRRTNSSTTGPSSIGMSSFTV